MIPQILFINMQIDIKVAPGSLANEESGMHVNLVQECNSSRASLQHSCNYWFPP
jgi:hypothetical protein